MANGVDAMNMTMPPRSPISNSSLVGLEAVGQRVAPGSGLQASFARLRRYVVNALPAIGLADGGDIDGAAEILARSEANKL